MTPSTEGSAEDAQARAGRLAAFLRVACGARSVHVPPIDAQDVRRDRLRVEMLANAVQGANLEQAEGLLSEIVTPPAHLVAELETVRARQARDKRRAESLERLVWDADARVGGAPAVAARP